MADRNNIKNLAASALGLYCVQIQKILLFLWNQISLNFISDPFAVEASKDNTKVHIRVQQRNGRKCITTVQGLADDLDILKITRALKKTFKCNGSVVQDEELGEVIQVHYLSLLYCYLLNVCHL